MKRYIYYETIPQKRLNIVHLRSNLTGRDMACNPAYFPITIKREKWEVYASCIAEEMLFDRNDIRFHKVPGTYLADFYKISSFEA